MSDRRRSDRWRLRPLLASRLCHALRAGLRHRRLGARSAASPARWSAPGALEVQGNRQVVQHPIGGVIKAIHARDGDEVKAGDVLVELDGEDLRPELGTVEGQWFEMLARKSRLHAERDELDGDHLRPRAHLARPTTPEIRDADRGAAAAVRRAAQELQSEEEAQLDEQQRQIGNQNEGLVALQAATDSRRSTSSAARSAGQQTLLDKGLTEVTRVLTPQRELARLQGAAGQAEANDRREPRQDRRDRDRAGAADLQGARGGDRRAARPRVPARSRPARSGRADRRPHRAARPARAGVGHRLRQHRRHRARGDPPGRAGDVHRAEGHAADRAHPGRHRSTSTRCTSARRRCCASPPSTSARRRS